MSDSTLPDAAASTDGTPVIEVTRNDDDSAYELRYNGKLVGIAQYELRGNQTVFTHTESDDALRGMGLASALAHHALDDVIARGGSIGLICPFISGYVDKHPEYREHVTAVQ